MTAIAYSGLGHTRRLAMQPLPSWARSPAPALSFQELARLISRWRGDSYMSAVVEAERAHSGRGPFASLVVQP